MEAEAKEHEAKIARSSGKDAFSHAIAAAELFMKAAASAASTPADKSRLKRKCAELIAQAERLKKSASEPPKPLVPAGTSAAAPQQSRDLPTSEQLIVARSSRLHGSFFPPWDSIPAEETFLRSGTDGELFIDTTPLPLSDNQRQIFAGWKRPAELFAPDGSKEAENLPERLMTASMSCDLVQDLTTDCSVVASLCAAMKHLGPKKDSMLSMLMYPFDWETGQPAVSNNGKYMFRMHFNGCFRRVTIDDRLPSSSTARTLFVVDRRNPYLIWPALMEKAYLKVRGGYDFPGSNSGTDLYVLTGWIPEQIFLRSDEVDADAIWSRVKKAYDYGDVVVTFGTGRLSQEEEQALGLAGEHDYASMDMAVEDGARRVLLKNPWCDGLVWKGVGSSAPLEAMQKLNLSDTTDGTTSPGNTTGTFWMNFEDVLQNFESLYLNWNPALFTHRQDHHFYWDIPSKTVAPSLAHNPQFSFSSSADGPVWVLLSRHFSDDELALLRSQSPSPERHHDFGDSNITIATDTLRNSGIDNPTSLAAVSSALGFMSLYVFTADGKRVDLADWGPHSTHRGPFVDSPQTLARLDAKRGVRYTVAVAQMGLPLPRYAFTLSFLSRDALTTGAAAPAMAHHVEVAGSWTRRTAGGNPATATYMHNPQFTITIEAPSRVSLLLTTDAGESVAVRVDLVWAGGRRVTALAARDIAASSGEYRRRCALASTPAPLQPGTYTAVVSTFESGQHADFALRVGTNTPVTIDPVPVEAAGMLRAQLAPIALRPGAETKRRAALTTDLLTRASVVARSGSLSGSSTAAGAAAGVVAPCAVRVALELSHGPHRSVLAVSGDGEFQDAAMGLRTVEVDVDPAQVQRLGLWLVVEQVGICQPGQGIQVDVLCDRPIQVGPWETLEDEW